MSHIAKVRMLLVTIRDLALYLTNEEISDIGLVLLRATERMERESKKDIKKE